MHFFEYKDDVLCCEDVAVEQVAREVGTPFYLYSRATLTRHFEAFDKAFSGMPHLVCYSAKANTSRALLQLFGSMGSGLDIVSGGELFRGKAAGIPADRIVYSGVGKTAREIDEALDGPILMFNVESEDELHLISARAKAKNTRAPVALRVNPDVDPKTHPYISTGLKKNKFGIGKDRALEAYQKARSLPGLDIVGIACHIGSQITELSPFVEAVLSIRNLVERLREMGVAIKYMDVGGGLGIPYNEETPPDPGQYASAICRVLQGLPVTVIVEPGRAIVGNAGVLVTRILYMKTGPDKNFAVVDAGMNDLVRPSMYDAFHAIWPAAKRKGEAVTADVVGPICESGDFFARNRDIGAARAGDLLAIMSAGAYGFSMSSNYNSRCRCAEVMVSGDRFQVVRDRETYEDLSRGERAFS